MDGLLAGKLGVTEAAVALEMAVRFPDDGGSDKAVAADSGPHGRLTGKLTVRPSSSCSVVLATHTVGAVSVDVHLPLLQPEGLGELGSHMPRVSRRPSRPS